MLGMIQFNKVLIVVAMLALMPLVVQAQTFSSGSTGADGALDLSTCPTNSCVIQLPDSGILNYTTVNIPFNRFVTFNRNSRNTPVYILAQGAVNIEGIINVSAGTGGFTGCRTNSCEGRVPGPGGFYGGDGGQAGLGPGGGQPNGTVGHGQWVGPLSLFPIIGGSGGAGGEGSGSCLGGGGGGAILIASSTSIVLNAAAIISAQGGRVGSCSMGSGGAIRLVANSIFVSNQVTLQAHDGLGTHLGVIRLEGNSIDFYGNATPAAVLSPINAATVSTSPPSLRITSIGGTAVPSYAGRHFDTVDLLLANQLQDPITVQVSANNIPVGTQINIGVFGSPSATTTPGTLSGTLQNSDATGTISGLNRAVPTYVFATAQFDPPPLAMKFNAKGKDRVAKLRIEAGVGAKPKIVFLRTNGTEIDQTKLPKAFLQQIGL